MSVFRIMFVCHGNICRSPMAEFIFRDMVKRRGKEDKFLIASSATSAEEIWRDIGNPVYPPAKSELEKHGLSCEGKRAVQLKKEDYNKYDLFLCMDNANVRNAVRILNNDPDKKVRLLLPDKDVSDPWFTNRFDIAYNDIYNGCRMLLEQLSNDV